MAASFADSADVYALYQLSVQSAEVDIAFYESVWHKVHGEQHREALILREDFSGTSLLSCTWTKRGPKRRAIAVDIDGKALDWCRKHNFSELTPEQKSRILLLQSDVRIKTQNPLSDIICAGNSSGLALTRRVDLMSYLRCAHSSLGEDGILLFELLGGTSLESESEDDPRAVPLPLKHQLKKTVSGKQLASDKFFYQWKQLFFNTATKELHSTMSFLFEDGSTVDPAFMYEWRMYSIPEVREAMADAGFSRTIVYFTEIDDEDVDASHYKIVEEAEQCDAWMAYIVGVK